MAAQVWANITDLLWPVGSVYRCLNETTNYPANMFGGYWEEIGTEEVNGETYSIYYRYA